MDFIVVIYFLGSISSSITPPTVIAVQDKDRCEALVTDLMKSNAITAACYVNTQSKHPELIKK